MRVHDTGQPHAKIAPSFSDRRLSRRSTARFIGGLLLAISLLFGYPTYGAPVLVLSVAILVLAVFSAFRTWREPGSKEAELVRPS